jgi:cell wall-associated NlpC family hydrolase
LIFVLLLPVTLVTAISGNGGSTVEQIGSGSPIPAGFVSVFNTAGQALDVNPYLLASVADQESTFGSGTAWTQVNSAGCVGFMQICIGGQGGDTWDETVNLTSSPHATFVVRNAYRYGQRPAGYPLQSATHPSYEDPFDAVMAAAAVLRNKIGGRPIPDLNATAYQAACGYYGACADPVANYAQTVISRAKSWESESALTASPVSLVNVPAGAKLQQLISVATQISDLRIPYCFGGGHGPTPGPSSGDYCHTVTNAFVFGDTEPGLDCSGAVRWLLTSIGFKDPGGISSGDFGSWLQPGPGRWVSVYYNADHTYMVIDGHPWGTSDHNYRGGPAWIPITEGTAGFIVAHPPGL